MMRLILSLLIVFIALLHSPVQAAASAESSYQQARKAYYQLQDSSRKQMYRENWLRVIGRFEVVQQKFPQHKRGADALYMCGKTASGLYAVSQVDSDAEAAVDFFEQMAQEYPGNRLADDALFLAATLLEQKLDDPQRAYLFYQRLVKNMPSGDMAAKAKSRQKALAAYAPKKTPAAAPAVTAQPKPVQSRSTTGAAPASGRSLTAIRFWSNPGYTRIVLDVSAQADFSAHYLAAETAKQIPPRLYIDIEGAALEASLKKPTIVDDGLLRRIRTGSPKEKTVRVVLDLDSIGDYKVFPLNDPYRIVIDIAGEKKPALKRRETEISALPASDSDAIAKVLNDAPQQQPALHIPKSKATSKLRRIVVDAGHGGRDPGAVGPNKVLEKDVTLKMAKALAKELRKRLKCEVVLTRSGDVYLPLEERTAIANKVDADLFISLHANANNSRKAYGIETYYLNFSKNDKAAAVAARENNTSLKQVSDLELILFDLMANSKINESSRLASEIQSNLVKKIGGKYSKVRDLGVKQGPFYVLLGATMPSVLVETAFISNPREEKRLVSKDFQNTAAKAIAEAVHSYAVSHKLIASR
ncbi:MAG: N-acetylmuramoyl-L-alanine amidase [Desulfuromonadales bacterium]|nr:N-acetylmuramoyl-L-alanine amidase [Desulfuromonadales bacterium]